MRFEGVMLILSLINLWIFSIAAYYNDRWWAGSVRDFCGFFGLGLITIAVINIIYS